MCPATCDQVVTKLTKRMMLLATSGGNSREPINDFVFFTNCKPHICLADAYIRHPENQDLCHSPSDCAVKIG